METTLKHFWSFAIVAISISLIPFFISSCAINPAPKADLETAGTSITEARQSIANARDEKAPEFAPNEFKDAEELLQKAEETFAKRRIEEAINFAFLTDTNAKIALAKTREAKAKYRIERAKDNKMEVYWEAKSNEVAIAKARQAIAEKVAFEAQQNSEISSEVAEIRVQRATVEQAIAKAEVEIKLAFILNAPKYAEQKYNNADTFLKEAKLALVNSDYDKAITSADVSSKQAIDAQIEAKSNADAENAEIAKKKDKAIIAMVKAELAFEEAHNSMADQYAKEIYTQAERTINESKKSFDSGDYDKATTLADQGKLSASNATAVVKTKVKDEKQNEQTEEIKANALDAVAKAEKSLVQAFNTGANESANDLYKQAQDSLEKAKQAINDKDYGKAITLAQEVVFNANLAIAKAEINIEMKKKSDELVKNILEDAQKIPNLNAKETEKGIVASISFDIFTKTGDIKPEAQPNLKPIADLIKKYPANRVIIEVHTDNTGTEKANIKLSSDRASAVLIYMSGVEGVSIDKLSSVGYGSIKPVAPNNDDAGRKQNRRIDFVMLVR
jgi:outer membrane protein OmpA-like peptidoglycan-associated protein